VSSSKTFHGYPVLVNVREFDEANLSKQSHFQPEFVDRDVISILEDCAIDRRYYSEYPVLFVDKEGGERTAVYGIEKHCFGDDDQAYLLWANYERFEDNLVLDLR
jgi:hypothetical protein